MRPGTPGFIGGRLREAREVRGISVASLSEVVQISPQAIYSYENDRTTPGPDILDRLALALNVPQAFFLKAARQEAPITVFYRSMAAATKTARRRAEHRFAWVRDLTAYVEEDIRLPQSNLPDLRLSDDPLLITDDEIEEAAERVRDYWRIGEAPIGNMVQLLEAQGAIVARDRLGADTLDGLSSFTHGRAYVLIGTDKGTPARWRFDAAHELGHLILHSAVTTEMLARPSHFKRIEEQAHRFASAFLLPLAPFGEDLFAANLDAFRALKAKWNVSIAMMIVRASQTGMISEATSRSLWINLSRRKWRKTEPLDDTTEPESPRTLASAIGLLLDRGERTPGDIAARLGIPAMDIEALSGLPAGTLAEHTRVTMIPTIDAAGNESLASEHEAAVPGQVIRMPPRRRT